MSQRTGEQSLDTRRRLHRRLIYPSACYKFVRSVAAMATNLLRRHITTGEDFSGPVRRRPIADITPLVLKVFGTPQADGTYQAYVLLYFTGTRPGA